jgi:hypothetical protein
MPDVIGVNCKYVLTCGDARWPDNGKRQIRSFAYFQSSRRDLGTFCRGIRRLLGGVQSIRHAAELKASNYSVEPCDYNSDDGYSQFEPPIKVQVNPSFAHFILRLVVGWLGLIGAIACSILGWVYLLLRDRPILAVVSFLCMPLFAFTFVYLVFYV